MINLEDAQPLRDDVLLVRVPKNKVEAGSNDFMMSLLGSEDADVHNDPTQMFRVIVAGPEVKNVKVGEVVVCPWTHITPPQDAQLNGKRVKFGITSEKEILAVIEGVENEAE